MWVYESVVSLYHLEDKDDFIFFLFFFSNDPSETKKTALTIATYYNLIIRG